MRTLTRPGDHVVLPGDAYGGTYRLFARVAEPWGVAFDTAPTYDLDAVARAIRPGRTRFVWVETPTNPLLGITDIAAVAALAHEAGALLVVDNTFATPYLQNPLELGADVVVHSTTKYVGGHSDVVGGALVTRAPDAAGAATDPHTGEPLADRLAWHQNAMGAVAGPFDAFLTLRGLKTLAVRMERHSASAARVAAYLDEHPARLRGPVPRAALPPRARRRRPPDAPARRDGELPAAPAAGTPRSRPARRRRCSPSPRASAASSRSSSTPAR